MATIEDEQAFYAEQRKIRYSETAFVSHKFCMLDDLTKPSAVVIGFAGLHGGLRAVEADNIQTVMDTVNRLREHQIDAVPSFVPEAGDPSKTVVSPGGIQTPVLKPEAVKEAAKEIFDALAVQDKSYRQGFEEDKDYRGYDASRFAICSALEVEQMSMPAIVSQRTSAALIDAGLLNPEGEEFVKNREKFGFDLEYNLIKEAENKGDFLTLDDLRKENDTSLNKLYRGGCLGDRPWVSRASRENKNFAYSTPDVATATMYSGAGQYNVGLKAFAEQEPEGVRFGFVYEFEAGKDAHLFGDYGLEQGYEPDVSRKAKDVRREDWEGLNLETPIMPQKNKLCNVYLHLKHGEEDRFYPIDRSDERWGAVLQMYRLADTSKRGYLIDRRRNVLEEKKVYSSLNNTKSLGIFKKKVQPLVLTESPEKLIKEANLTIEEKMPFKTKRKSFSPEEIEARLRNVRQKMSHAEANSAVDRAGVVSFSGGATMVSSSPVMTNVVNTVKSSGGR